MNLTETRILTLEQQLRLLQARTDNVAATLNGFDINAAQQFVLGDGSGLGVGTALGFSGTSDYFWSTFDSEFYDSWDNILFNVGDFIPTLLPQCGYFMAGMLPNSCGDTIGWSVTEFDAIGEWIYNGGRMALCLEYGGCVHDPANVALFLSAIGSTISDNGGLIDCHGNNPVTQIPTAVPLAGTGTFTVYCSCAIDGGTPVYMSSDGSTPTMACERIGDGYLLVWGDSNTWAVSGDQDPLYENMSFIEAFFDGNFRPI